MSAPKPDTKTNYPDFVRVAEAGEQAIGLGVPLSMTLGSITDPEEAFRTAYAMWSLWCLIEEGGYKTIIHLFAPQHIEGKIFQIEAIPLVDLREVLTEVKAMAERIARTATLDWLGYSFDTAGVTLRVKIWKTKLDVHADTDIDQLYAKWEQLETENNVPVFGEPLGAGVALTTGDVVVAL